jgi:hypothetical protein
MRNSETLHRVEPYEAYAHNFSTRFRRVGNLSVDVMEQIIRHGIVSPRRARELDIPHRTSASITFRGVEDYDDIVFMFPLKDRKTFPVWEEGTTVLINGQLPVVTPERMMIHQNGRWIVLSSLNGEVYRYGDVNPSFFEEIHVQSGWEKEEATQMIEHYQPELKDKISVKVIS